MCRKRQRNKVAHSGGFIRGLQPREAGSPLTIRLPNDLSGTREKNEFGWAKITPRVHASMYAEATC